MRYIKKTTHYTIQIHVTALLQIALVRRDACTVNLTFVRQNRSNTTTINVTVFAQVAFVCRDACTNTRTFSSVTDIRQTE